MKKRVKIPVGNPAAMLDLAKKVQSKHVADGDASALKILNWSEISPSLEAALASHEKATQLKREMLENYQQRDLKLESVANALRDSRDILTGAFKKEMKVLGQWGYDVMEVRNKTGKAKAIEIDAKA